MDSRFGASPTPTKSGVTTLIDEMGDIGLLALNHQWEQELMKVYR